MKGFIRFFFPPQKWRFTVILMLGIFTGALAWTFHVSKASSYLSDEAETCTNCHIMSPQYATWNHSSHREVANCNDCHVPHNNVFNKYFFKAKDGMRHASVFTMRNEPQVIFIKEEGKQVVHDNCIRCHSDLITDSKLMQKTDLYHTHRMNKNCTDCHMEVPHGSVNSLSSVPNAHVPLPESPIPDWIKKSKLKE